ncbi:hypothetical protein G7A72_13330 [Flavobacterium sp. Sr18]|uniref:hypothetical protein n=1 Tax=Flavobacterium sp. Sr18 TaxID=935222 RepID=UPI0013E4968B|nr:hypothetical protein [Flavobacterium sp. Sr18]QIH39732.1 hypothetical protein G7A72_13330 [Flavobacterium sp. Sr18]
MKTATIPLEEYNHLLEINEKYKCLREHLEKANELFKSLGEELGNDTQKRVAAKSKPKPRETKQQRIDKYKRLIETGARAKKPDHLKKK